MNCKLRVASCQLPAAIISLALIVGCAGGPHYSMDTATTQPSYWLDQPGTATVDGNDFDRLWRVCEDVARDYLFKLDRQDPRSGILTTQPMVSPQWFEPWRREAPTIDDRDESTIATIRRTIEFEFKRVSPGTWQVAPKVLVERQVIAERRITSVVLYRSAFSVARAASERPTGTHESDQGIFLPQRYWYPLRRDQEFERIVADAVQRRMRSS